MNISSRAIIKTKILPVTNTRGARIKATCQAGSVTIGYVYEHGGADMHWEAVKALIAKLGLNWGNEFTVGSDNDGYYFIPRDDFNTATIEV
jgi:hypothetical protein